MFTRKESTRYRSTRLEEFCKKMFLKISQISQGKTRPDACNFIKKETLAEAFSCKFCEMFKNTFFCKTPLVVASVDSHFHHFDHHFHELCQKVDIAFAFWPEPSINIFLKFTKTRFKFYIIRELILYFWI